MDIRLKELRDSIIENAPIEAKNVSVTFDNPDPDVLFEISFEVEEN